VYAVYLFLLALMARNNSCRYDCCFSFRYHFSGDSIVLVLDIGSVLFYSAETVLLCPMAVSVGVILSILTVQLLSVKRNLAVYICC